MVETAMMMADKIKQQEAEIAMLKAKLNPPVDETKPEISEKVLPLPPAVPKSKHAIKPMEVKPGKLADTEGVDPKVLKRREYQRQRYALILKAKMMEDKN